MSEIRGKSNVFRQTSIKSDNVVGAAAAAAAEYRQPISYQATIGDAQGAPQCDKALKLIIDCHIAALVLSNLYRVIDFIATARCVPQKLHAKGPLRCHLCCCCLCWWLCLCYCCCWCLTSPLFRQSKKLLKNPNDRQVNTWVRN